METRVRIVTPRKFFLRDAEKTDRTVGRKVEQDRVTTFAARVGPAGHAMSSITLIREGDPCDANEITDGITEVRAYGAVVVQQA
jgi:hypothetical protein